MRLHLGKARKSWPHGGVLLRGAFLSLLSYQIGWAQSDAGNPRVRTDVVQMWSAEVLRDAERRTEAAELTLQLLEHMQSRSRHRLQDRYGVEGGFNEELLTVSAWPRSYADVLYRVSQRLGLFSRVPRSRLLGSAEISLVTPARIRPDGSNVLHQRMHNFEPLLIDILRKEGLPDELLAIPLVESGFDPLAESPKGARGLWQLMPETARRFGLNPDGSYDQRLDPVLSTVAAARYLKELYRLWGDWALALAAYNAGEGRVKQALSGRPYGDFATLATLKRLPEETRQYVPAVLAAARRFKASKNTPAATSRRRAQAKVRTY